MRERYLYKAKRVDDGEWVCGSLITGVFRMTESGADVPYILNVNESDADCFEDFTEGREYLEVIPKTICQCTGLRDKNGKIIWENDIVEYRDYTTEYCVIAYEYDKKYFEFSNKYGCSIMHFDELTCVEVEVIGNRFDNLELLEV